MIKVNMLRFIINKFNHDQTKKNGYDKNQSDNY